LAEARPAARKRFILSVSRPSVAMVSAVYVFLWLADLKKRKGKVLKPAFHRGRKVCGGEIVVAAQLAK